MFPKYRTDGLILKKIDIGEADQLLVLFTKDFGRIEVLAKGIRKITSKLRSAIDIFYLSEIEFVQGKNQKKLTDALLKEKFLSSRKDLKKLSALYKLSDVFNELIKEEEKDEKLWRFFLKILFLLERMESDNRLINFWYYYFFWNFVSLLGSRPELYRCVVCQKKTFFADIFFSSEEGGLMCQNCFLKIKKGKRVGKNSIKILRLFLEKKFDFLKKLKIRGEEIKILRGISEDYFRYLAEKKYEEKISFN